MNRFARFTFYAVVLFVIALGIFNFSLYQWEIWQHRPSHNINNNRVVSIDPLLLSHYFSGSTHLGTTKQAFFNALKEMIPESILASSFSSIDNSLSNIADSTSVLTIDHIDTTVKEITFYSMYQFVDDAIVFFEKLINDHPKQIIVWKLPPSILTPSFTHNLELEYVFYYLLLRNIVSKYRIFLIPIASECALLTENSSQTNCFNLILNNKLISLYSFLKSQHQGMMCPPGSQYCVLTTMKQYLARTREESQSMPNIALRALCQKYLNTRKYHPDCMPRPTTLYPILITGLGGSGTHFMANELQKIGLHLNHEELGRDGSVCWLYAINDWLSNVTYPYGTLSSSSPMKRSFLNPRFEHVFHLVRSPLKQIASMTTHSNKTYQFLYDSILTMPESYTTTSPSSSSSASLPLIVAPRNTLLEETRKVQSYCFRRGACHLPFATIAWIYWNEYVSSYADHIYQVESESFALVNDVCKLLWPQYHLLSPDESISCVVKRAEYLHQSIWLTVEEQFLRRSYVSKAIHRDHEDYNLTDIVTRFPSTTHNILQLLSQRAQLYNYTLSYNREEAG